MDEMSHRPKPKCGQAINNEMKLVVVGALAPIKPELPQIDSIM